MQLSQNTRPITGREFYPLKFAATIGPHADIKLVGIFIAANDRRGIFKIIGDIIGVGNRQRIGVEGDDGNIRDTENPLVTAAPRVFNDHATRKVLRLLLRGRGRVHP